MLELTYEFMNNPAQITVSPEQVTVERVEQVLYHAGRHEKFGLLLGLLAAEQGGRTLIFANTRDEVHRLVERLERNGHAARALSGDVDQRKRLKTLEAFKDGSVPILVATDVASRGLHIPDVSHVYNWDLPQDPEDYVHRIGRTARAGAFGKAISLVDEASAFSLEARRALHRPAHPRRVGRGRAVPARRSSRRPRSAAGRPRRARRAGPGALAGAARRRPGPAARPAGGRPRGPPARDARAPPAAAPAGRGGPGRGTAGPAAAGGAAAGQAARPARPPPRPALSRPRTSARSGRGASCPPKPPLRGASKPYP